MLRAMRKSEEGYKDESHIAFLMQVQPFCQNSVLENPMFNASLSLRTFLFFLVPPPFLPPPPSPLPIFSSLSLPLLLPFLSSFMQEPDLCYLVENIWGGQSALSAVQELFELVLVRWDRQEQWSPWNCILLTKDEAKAHCRLDNVQEVCVIMCVWGHGGSVYGGGEEEQGNAR